MRKITIIAILISMTGCATVDMAAEGINRYCAAFTWQERAVIRERVNEQVAPHRVAIDCAGSGNAVY